jgi:hypothetical protein
VTHLGFTLLLALLLSAVLAVTGVGTVRERLYHAAYVFTTSTAAVIAGAWLMFLVER